MCSCGLVFISFTYKHVRFTLPECWWWNDSKSRMCVYFFLLCVTYHHRSRAQPSKKAQLYEKSWTSILKYILLHSYTLLFMCIHRMMVKMMFGLFLGSWKGSQIKNEEGKVESQSYCIFERNWEKNERKRKTFSLYIAGTFNAMYLEAKNGVLLLTTTLNPNLWESKQSCIFWREK